MLTQLKYLGNPPSTLAHTIIGKPPKSTVPWSFGNPQSTLDQLTLYLGIPHLQVAISICENQHIMRLAQKETPSCCDQLDGHQCTSNFKHGQTIALPLKGSCLNSKPNQTKGSRTAAMSAKQATIFKGPNMPNQKTKIVRKPRHLSPKDAARNLFNLTVVSHEPNASSTKPPANHRRRSQLIKSCLYQATS